MEPVKIDEESTSAKRATKNQKRDNGGIDETRVQENKRGT